MSADPKERPLYIDPAFKEGSLAHAHEKGIRLLQYKYPTPNTEEDSPLDKELLALHHNDLMTKSAPRDYSTEYLKHVGDYDSARGKLKELHKQHTASPSAQTLEKLGRMHEIMGALSTKQANVAKKSGFMHAHQLALDYAEHHGKMHDLVSKELAGASTNESKTALRGLIQETRSLLSKS